MSQEHLASVSGVSVRTIRRAEGGGDVSGETVRCLCASLGLDAERLARPQVGPLPTHDVVDGVAREIVEASLTRGEDRVARAAAGFPAVVVAISAILAMAGAWQEAHAGALALLGVPLIVTMAGGAWMRRMDPPSVALVTGGVLLHVGIVWLGGYGAEAPWPLQILVTMQLAAGLAAIAVGIRARHRDWDAAEAQGGAGP